MGLGEPWGKWFSLVALFQHITIIIFGLISRFDAILIGSLFFPGYVILMYEGQAVACFERKGKEREEQISV